MKLGLAVFVLFGLCACTNKSLYQMGGNYQKSECIKQARSESQLMECEREAVKRPSYEDYEAQKVNAEKDR